MPRRIHHHRNPQRLEDAAYRKIRLVRGQSRHRPANRGRQFTRSGEALPRQRRSQHPRPRFVGILDEQDLQRIGPQPFEQCRQWLPALRIHPHVQRAVEFHRETPRRIVDLHRRQPQIGQNEISASQARASERLRQSREIASLDRKHPSSRTRSPATAPRSEAIGLGRRGVRAVVRPGTGAGRFPGCGHPSRSCSPPRFRPAAAREPRESRTRESAGAFRPAFLPETSTLATVSAYRAGSRSLYFSSNRRGYFPE